MNDMRALDQKMRPAARQINVSSTVVEPKLTTEERNRILKLRHVAPSDVAAYSTLLAQDHTGIFKLFPDLGCVSKDVILLTRACSESVPMSSSFTFRAVSYGDDLYHDIIFKGDRILSHGFFSQGIFTAVGDEPIEKIELSHPALKYFNAFQADNEPKSAIEHARQLRSGVEFEGHSYSDGITPKENQTYAVRLIAYRLENTLKPLSATSTMTEMLFLSLAVDKRLDMVVVFRILGRDDHGGLTIVWKELSRQDASKIKFSKGQILRDFKPEQN